MIRLAECTFEEAAELARDSKAVIVLPLGAIEEHGPHLPLLVDWLGAEELARVIAPHLRRAGWRPVLAPLGVRHLDMPVTPERVWRAISSARDASSAAR